MRDVPRHHFLRRVRAQGAPDRMRRLADLVIACVLLAITVPLMVFIALVIKWESPGPVFEREGRIGPGGRQFQMLSFRTTAQRPGQLRSIWQMTQVGQFLRSTRIDALPQLINVLRGEMRLADIFLFY